MAKRKSIRGMGADMFTPQEESSTPASSRTGVPAQQHNGIHTKATFYLPSNIIERLEKVWLTERDKKRKLTKSDIVRELLDMGLRQKEKDLHI